MRKLILPVFIIAALFACDKIKNTVVCGKYDVRMKFVDDGEKMNVTINGERLVLNLVPSASGAKYNGVMQNGDTLTLWGKGDEWTVLVNDGKGVVCK